MDRISTGRLPAAGVVWAIALLAILGFTAEPSTSTQFDAHEGRGVFVTQTIVAKPVVTADAENVPGTAAVLALVVGLAALLLGTRSYAVVTGPERQLRRSTLRWPASTRRGPPSLV